MNSIYDSVKVINAELEKIFNSCKIAGGEINGIAETVVQDDKIMPVVDERYVGIDDVYPARFYHRLAGLASSIKPNTGTGRSAGLQLNQYTCGMVIFLDRNKTGLYPDELMLIVQANFPEQLSRNEFGTATAKFTGGVLDSRAVYQQEYGNMKYRLKEGQYLFRINYLVETVFDKRCFQKCP